MYVNVAALAETRAHEGRMAPVPSRVPGLVKLGPGFTCRPAPAAPSTSLTRTPRT
jgi:NAD(P) transhydrogenase subunit alpha